MTSFGNTVPRPAVSPPIPQSPVPIPYPPLPIIPNFHYNSRDIIHDGGFHDQKYADLLLAALFAVFTGLFVPLSPSLLWGSINWNLLGILFCLMVITAEIGKWGIPRALCLRFFSGKGTVRQMARFFIFACFSLPW